MIPLKNKKTYPFQSFQGKTPTGEELRVELEEVYKYLKNEASQVIEELRLLADRHDEVLCMNGEIVFIDGDAVMVIGIPNNNNDIWQL